MIMSPIAAGGIGGSGTRVIAQILQHLGVFLGPDLPASQDTIWFALLFGRRDIFLQDDSSFEALTSLFYRQMAAPQPLSPEEVQLVRELANQDRSQHNRQTLHRWAESFIAHGITGTPQSCWGWKVPYTHVIVDRLLKASPHLKYVHLTRNGLDMAFSRNQNQLAAWGPIFLNRNIEICPRDSLAFWCAVHRRMQKTASQFPDRVLMLSYDQLMADPIHGVLELLRFLQIEAQPATLESCCSHIRPPASLGRHQQHDLSVFRAEDLAYHHDHSVTQQPLSNAQDVS